MGRLLDVLETESPLYDLCLLHRRRGLRVSYSSLLDLNLLDACGLHLKFDGSTVAYGTGCEILLF